MTTPKDDATKPLKGGDPVRLPADLDRWMRTHVQERKISVETFIIEAVKNEKARKDR